VRHAFLFVWGVLLVAGGVVAARALPLIAGAILVVLGATGERVDRRNRRRAEARAAAIAALPPEYRPWRAHPAIVVAGFGSAIGAVFVGTAISKLASMLLLGVVVCGWVVGLLWRERRRNRNIIASVEARAETLPRDELESLVTNLEVVYTKRSMGSLRPLPGR
jgi:hypothetical protein